MSDIFSGTQLPAWLVSATHEDSGGLGKSIGTVLAGGLLALQKNEDGDGLKGFEQGVAEARMNQQDPAWRVKEKTLEGQAVANWAKAATQWQQVDATQKDMSSWMLHDLPAISKFQEELKTNPEAVPPVVESGKGLQVINQLEKSQLALQVQKIKQDNTKLAIENAKTSLGFDQAVSAAPVGIGSAIDELPNQGWNLDKQGKRTTPSTAALRLYNDWATNSGKNPEKAFGYKPTTVDAAKARGEAQIKVEEKRGELKSSLEDKRQVNRMAIKLADIASKEHLEKLKEDAIANGKDGKAVSEDEYVNRHMNETLALMYKDNANKPTDKQESVQDIMADADQSLRALYKASRPKQAKAATATTTMTTNTPLAATSTNDISFDDFQKWKGGK